MAQNKSKNNQGLDAPIPLHVPDEWSGILVIGERANKNDYAHGVPFRSSFGVELQKLLAKAGISLKKCALTYVYKQIPRANDIKNHMDLGRSKLKTGEAVEFEGRVVTPEFKDYVDVLRGEIEKLKPKFIITVGEAALFGALGEKGIDDFRGSMEWYTCADGSKIPALPTHSPARIFKQPQLRFLVSRDLGRVGEHFEKGWPEPEYRIIINPDKEKTVGILRGLLHRLVNGERIKLGVDLETRKKFYIGTCGIAWSESDAIVIPFIDPDWNPYWKDVEDELEIVGLIKEILEHKNAKVAGQNYHYDAQYLARHWGVRSRIWCDTMIAHHVCFSSEIPKALHVITSIYADYYQYWKDESHAEGDDKWEPTWDNWDRYLEYNGKDCCTTITCANELMDNAIPSFGLMKAWRFQKKMWPHVLKVMLRGNRYSWEERKEQRATLTKQFAEVEKFMETIVPEDIYPRNPKTPFYKSGTQLCDLFFNVLSIPPTTVKRAPGVYTQSVNDESLKVIMLREPLVKPLCEALLRYRSMRVFFDTFLAGQPDYDDYLRSMYHLAGTSTYRLASRKDVFDFGLNLQNLPKGDG